MTPREAEHDLERLIDQLVDGELPAPERRALLVRLDADPGGLAWRRCALAFLEAQTWREAVATATEPARETEPPASRRRRVAPWLRMAAALAGAFLLGLAARGPSPTTVVVERTPPAAPAAPAVEADAPPAIEVADTEAEADDDAEADDALAAWRRQGFAVDQRERTMSLELADGRSVAVPVSEVRLKYLGDRTY